MPFAHAHRAKAANAAAAPTTPMATSVRAAAFPLVVDEAAVDRASAMRLEADAISDAFGLSLTSEQICGAISAAWLTSSDEHEEVRTHPPTEAMRRSELEQRQVRSDTEQPMVSAPDSRQERAHLGNWLTKSGRLVVEVEPDVEEAVDVGESVAVCAMATRASNRRSDTAL